MNKKIIIALSMISMLCFSACGDKTSGDKTAEVDKAFLSIKKQFHETDFSKIKYSVDGSRVTLIDSDGKKSLESEKDFDKTDGDGIAKFLIASFTCTNKEARVLLDSGMKVGLTLRSETRERDISVDSKICNELDKISKKNKQKKESKSSEQISTEELGLDLISLTKTKEAKNGESAKNILLKYCDKRIVSWEMMVNIIKYDANNNMTTNLLVIDDTFADFPTSITANFKNGSYKKGELFEGEMIIVTGRYDAMKEKIMDATYKLRY